MRARRAKAFVFGLGIALLCAMPAGAAPASAVAPGAMKATVAGSALVEKVRRRHYRSYRYVRPYRYRYVRRYHRPYVYGYSLYPYYGHYRYGYRFWRPGFGIYFSF